MHPVQAHSLTSKANNMAIIADETTLSRPRSLDPYAAIPIMEGKAVLYKKFRNVDTFPICLNVTKKTG